MSKPNFTGQWKLNLEKSRLQIPTPASSLFVIEHREPTFRLTRTNVYGSEPNTISFEGTTDGAESEHDFGEVHARMRLYWDGDTLVADMHVRTKDDAGTNIVRYSLEDEGRMFRVVEQARSPKYRHDNLWIFDRA